MNKLSSVEKCKKLMKQTLVALKNPYQSVNHVFEYVVDQIDEKNIDEIYYLGIKDVEQIPHSIASKLKSYGFLLHTLDHASLGGRAIDVSLINPLTSKPMTGSSSGTAINVFCGINDLGIGTDGGGSVLSPSMSLNLFGLISPLIEEEHMKKYARTSTDGITFSPSIGLISKDYNLMIQAFGILMDYEWKENNICHILSSYKVEMNTDKKIFPNSKASRREMIDFLLQHLPSYDVLIDVEGPIDLIGFGDTVFGHFDERTHQIQAEANKCLSKVANMVNATAVVIPKKELSCAYILICESKIEKIEKMLTLAASFVINQDELCTSYFADGSKYIKKGYL